MFKDDIETKINAEDAWDDAKPRHQEEGDVYT